jgi:hypothetical protein
MPHPPKKQHTAGKILLLATEQQVHAFDLSETFRIAIGRHDTNDIQLGSRSVSSYHAEVLNEADGLVIHDLRSTNGTYVNDEEVRQHPLKDGDQICIGNHVLTVHLKPLESQEDGFIRYRRNPESFGVGTRGNIFSMRAGSKNAIKTLQVRDPRDLTLADLLKILTTNARTVMLSLRKDQEQGYVFVRKDRIVHAEYRQTTGEKALYRLFRWMEATYEVKEFPTAPTVQQTIDLPTDTLLMEGMQQVGELTSLLNQLPPLEVPLRLKEDCPLPLTAHTSAEIEIYQRLIRYQTIATVLEETPMPDVRILRLIHALIRKGVFEVADSSSALLEETFVFRRDKVFPSGT